MTKKSSEPNIQNKEKALPNQAEASVSIHLSDVPKPSGVSTNLNLARFEKHHHEAPIGTESNTNTEYASSKNKMFQPSTIGFIMVYLLFAIISMVFIVFF
jgi:hypothetical protein